MNVQQQQQKKSEKKTRRQIVIDPINCCLHLYRHNRLHQFSLSTTIIAWLDESSSEHVQTHLINRMEN